jgi:hypothetical protein
MGFAAMIDSLRFLGERKASYGTWLFVCRRGENMMAMRPDIALVAFVHPYVIPGSPPRGAPE